MNTKANKYAEISKSSNRKRSTVFTDNQGRYYWPGSWI